MLVYQNGIILCFRCERESFEPIGSYKPNSAQAFKHQGFFNRKISQNDPPKA